MRRACPAFLWFDLRVADHRLGVARLNRAAPRSVTGSGFFISSQFRHPHSDQNLRLGTRNINRLAHFDVGKAFDHNPTK